MISSYVPRKCGIATFSHDLASAIAEEGLDRPLASADGLHVVAMNDRPNEYMYGPEVAVQIGQHRKKDYWSAAEVINTGRIDVVSVQHEYGLYGGEDGDYLFELLDRLRTPVVSTLHTILGEPTPGQRRVLTDLCMRSSAVVVMAQRARQLLTDIYDVPADRIRLIHHGVPDVPFGDTEPFKKRFGLSGRPTILTFGLLSSGKGVEGMLEALAKVVPDHPEAAYIILGATHPAVRRESGESYRMSLERRVIDLGIKKNVIFHNRYVANEDLRAYLQAADIFVTSYPGKEQITSGTLTYALAVGCAVLSTPYRYAEELLADGRGILVEYDDRDGWAQALGELIGNKQRRDSFRRAAYEHGRQMVWPRVAREYIKVFEHVRHEYVRVPGREEVAGVPTVTMSLPEVRLDHLLTMTDSVGLFQHADHSVPDRRHGYCTDDNARGMIVCGVFWSLYKDERVLPLLRTYLSFIHYAQPSAGGRFRNFLSYDRRWLDDGGGDDCQGRVIWSLGHLISHAPDDSIRSLAESLFRRAVTSIRTLTYPRAWALSILGLHYYLRTHPDDAKVRTHLATLAGKLNQAFVDHETDEWPWFEDVLTYNNGRLPQALIIAGFGLDNEAMIARGIRVLDWLLEIQKSPNGRLSVIGCKGWHHRGGERAKCDQQPLEPAALIGACKAAHRVTDNRKWLAEKRRCFEWYLGYNDEGLALLNFKTRGCHDGLEHGAVNSNQGAEALVSWLLSLLTMHELQSGDQDDLG